MNCLDVECAVMAYFKPRINLIIPNVSWGMFDHECDLLVVTKSGCTYEVEIKVSKYDLIKDKLKRHCHSSSKINRLYFAIPFDLMPFIEHIPEHAGIIKVKEDGSCIVMREAKKNNEYKLTDKEKFQAARLGTLRILGLKKKIRDLLLLQKGIVVV